MPINGERTAACLLVRVKPLLFCINDWRRGNEEGKTLFIQHIIQVMETLRTSTVSTEGGFNKVPWELVLRGVDWRRVHVHIVHVRRYMCVYIMSGWVCSVVGRHVVCITHQRKVRHKHRVGLKVRARLYIEQREGWSLSKLSLGGRLLEVTKPLTWRTDLMS